MTIEKEKMDFCKDVHTHLHEIVVGLDDPRMQLLILLSIGSYCKRSLTTILESMKKDGLIEFIPGVIYNDILEFIDSKETKRYDA